MINYWWVTRPKRKLDSIPQVLALFAKQAIDQVWNRITSRSVIVIRPGMNDTIAGPDIRMKRAPGKTAGTAEKLTKSVYHPVFFFGGT